MASKLFNFHLSHSLSVEAIVGSIGDRKDYFIPYNIMIGSDDTLIEKYGRHVPPILGKQLVLKLIDQYLDNYHRFLKSDELKHSVECVPSIERFHGAMLFVDISGFTALSQRLNVDELRIHINGYFKKILDLVFKFNGEVIKFAGDALFIIWQTKVTMEEGEAFEKAQYQAVAAATACGMEINQTCSNYKVAFFQQDLHNSLITSALMDHRDAMPVVGQSTKISPNPTEKKENFTFLNVHAGVSVGTMAGLDVGANNRWEYLLVGEPLVSVAKAESEAAVAELVLCLEAHSVIHKFDDEYIAHGYNDYLARWQEAIEKSELIPQLPCGCQMTRGGLFKVNQTIIGGSNLDADDEPDPEYELAFYAELMHNVTVAYDTMKPLIYECYNNIIKKQKEKLLEVGHGPEGASSKEVQLYSFTDADDKLFVHYLHWVQNCITDDLVRHVHEADRGNFTLRNLSRTGSLLNFARDNLNLEALPRSITNSTTPTHLSSSVSLSTSSWSMRRRSEASDSFFVSKIRNFSESTVARRKKKQQHERTLQQDSTLTAELRSVMVLFIKLDITGSLELYIDPVRPTLEQQSIKDNETFNRIRDMSLLPFTNGSPRINIKENVEEGIVIEGFNFLKRTSSEIESDSKLLMKFQSCMEIMTKVFLDKGGQMRQFIVDDKGTVCIGTFGLRGSVNNDNAAAAIETAQEIIDLLAEIDIRAGVGITSGKAYCGLVGSTQRHEYAVMGPSTNLSARLMAKSEWGEILCSEDARSRDRTHNFDSCGTIAAKGYSYPVPIFKPNKGHIQSSPVKSHGVSLPTIQIPGSPKSVAHQQHQHPKSKLLTIGRQLEMSTVYAFLFPTVHSIFPDISVFEAADPSNDCETKLAELTLDSEFSAKLCIVESGNGVGKSNFVQTFASHLRSIHKADHSLNLSVFQNKSSSFCSSELFGAWKGVFEQILLSLPSVLTSNGKTRGEKLVMGLDMLVDGLSNSSMIELKPLLSTINYVKDIPPTKAASALSGANRVTKTVEFLAALIQQYCTCMKNVVAIVMDDLQSMDSASWQLLKQLFTVNKGIAILGTFRPDSGNSPTSKSSSIADILDFFGNFPDRFVSVHLDVFNEPTTWLFCEHLMEMYNIKGANHALFSSMHEIAGGNPLYLYEITASFVEKYSSTGSFDLSTPSRSSAFSDMVKKFSSTRIEEVISYRFDQLDPSSQLLLKMASVVCANGAKFSVALLSFMMQDHDNNESKINKSGIFKLMKAATVAHINTDDVDDVPNQEKFNIIETLKGLLKKNEFIKNSSSGNSSSRGSRLNTGSSSVRVRRGTLSTKRAAFLLDDLDDEPVNFEIEMSEDDELEYYGSLEFDFKVNLEQTSIYSLMLNDQKESLHDRVASYLEKKAADAMGFTTPTPTEMFEQGFHWEHATNWSAAMTCYYKSAIQLESMGAFEEKFVHLSAAYRMLNAMRRDAGVFEAQVEVPASFQMLFSSGVPEKIAGSSKEHVSDSPRSIAASAVTRAKLSPRSQSVNHGVTTLTKEIVAKIFYYDCELLEMGLDITLKLAQAGFSLSFNYTASSRLYEEALQMILVTWKDNIFMDQNDDFKPQVSPRGDGPSIPGRMKRMNSAIIPPPKSTSLDDFGLSDPTICFPMLTGISALYRFNRLKDDENHTREATLINLFVTLAQSSPAYRMHLIVAYCYKRSICFDQDKRQESIHLTDIARHYYDHDLYSAEVARIYGNDRMPFTMAMNLQLLIMMGQHFRAKNYMFHVLDLLPRVYHLHSMGITVLVLAPLLVQFGMPHKAYEIFKMYVTGVEARGAFSFFHESNPVFMDWLNLEVVFHDYRLSGDASVLATESLSDVFSTKYLGKTVEQRPVYFSALDIFGTSLELVCSKLCLLRAEIWTITKERSESEIFANLSFALKYANFNIACTQKESRLAFGYYSSLLTKATILMAIGKRAKKSCLHVEEEVQCIKREAKDCLLTCLEFGKKHDYLSICLSAGVYLEQLNIDDELGSQIQLEYARVGTFNTNGAALSYATVKVDKSLANEEYFKIGEVTPQDNFGCLSRLFPVVEKFRDLLLPPMDKD